MDRTHIHMAIGEPGSDHVISGKLSFLSHLCSITVVLTCLGMRRSCQVLVYIDLVKALAGNDIVYVYILKMEFHLCSLQTKLC